MHDPTLPASQPEKPKLKPANENPWYCLMTLHGEQQDGADIWNFDRELHAKNRRHWNRWAAQALTAEQREKLLTMREKNGSPSFQKEELTPLTKSEISGLLHIIQTKIKNFNTLDQNCDLSNLHVKKFFSISGFIFPGTCDFSNSIFDCDVTINNTIFFGLTDFLYTTFLKKSECNNTNFMGYTDFKGSKFNSSLECSNSNFFKSLILSDSIFNNSVNFSHSVFSGVICSIENTTFYGHTDFSGTVFSCHTDFSGTNFTSATDMSNAIFKRSISFEGARFKTWPPNFHESALHSDTNWLDVKWPVPPKERSRAASHVRNYQRLKQIMEGLKKHEDELDFFAREMAAQRIVDGDWKSPRGILNGLYALTSDYGRSISRPTLALFPLIVLPGMLFDGLSAYSVRDLLPYEAIGLSISNTFGILAFAKDTNALKDMLPWAKSLGFIQSTIGATLLFLIGLALRNRFRMK